MSSETDPDPAVADRLERFIRHEGRVAPSDSDFDRQVDLFSAGYLDSLGLLHLITYLEQDFGVVLDDEAFIDPDFVTIDGMSRLISRALRLVGPETQADVAR
ncbi:MULTISPECIES: acyl carrier protein [Micromonospora]|uniref:Acyl carrier protein n=1 Tax=Micromonospora sp. HUAS YX12 TaxID=3156396 RepID=A0AAU7R3U5_9ACTN